VEYLTPIQARPLHLFTWEMLSHPSYPRYVQISYTVLHQLSRWYRMP